jgi:hypothetical protein
MFEQFGRLRLFAGFVAALGLMVFAAACGGDRAISELDVGISKDSTLKIFGAVGDDTLHNVYDYGNYIISGKILEIYYYDPKNRKFRRDSVDRRKDVTPVVMVDSKVAGWGWVFVDSVAGANNIQLPTK